MGKEEIITRLVEWSREDAGLRERLDLLVARTSGKRIRTPPYKKAIRAATSARKRLNQRESTQTANRVRRILGELRALLDQDGAAQVVELAEFAIDRIVQFAPRLDYRSEVVDVLLEEARELHLEACEEELPDPAALAAFLYKCWKSGRAAFQDPSRVYSRILGEKGRREFLRLAESEWDEFPVLRPRNDDYFYYDSSTSRRQLTELLKEHARSEGDIDRLVEICKKDLSFPSNYLETAEILRDAGRFDEAVEWACVRHKQYSAFRDRPSRPQLLHKLASRHNPSKME